MLRAMTAGLRASVRRWRAPVAVVGVAAGIAAAAVVTIAAGGTATAYPQLFYVPIVIAASQFGLLAGAATGVLCGFAAGPHMPLDASRALPQTTYGWVARLLVFALVGLIVGALADRGRRREAESHRLAEEVAGAFARAIDAKHPRTARHSEKVAEYSVAIGRRLGLDAEQLDRLHWSALLHDVGKISLPSVLLDKLGPLNEAEWAEMHRHPVESERILAGVDRFHEYLPAIRHHHERVDGRGYPDRLLGDEIPLGARIIAVADTVDAMTSNRAYRGEKDLAQALDVLRELAGSQFDPLVVEAACEVLEECPPGDAEWAERRAVQPLAAAH